MFPIDDNTETVTDDSSETLIDDAIRSLDPLYEEQEKNDFSKIIKRCLQEEFILIYCF